MKLKLFKVLFGIKRHLGIQTGTFKGTCFILLLTTCDNLGRKEIYYWIEIQRRN
ncbi:hypothetical protein YQE_03873, partial [Dendroctonus ponderosae]